MNDSMSGFVGTDVVLHCSFTNPLPGVKITQVTWQKATNGSKDNMAIYNPAMGVSVLAPYRERVEFLRPSFTDGTIRLSRLELEDEGVYICEFATFPAGNREGQLNLTVMGKPPARPAGRCMCLRGPHGRAPAAGARGALVVPSSRAARQVTSGRGRVLADHQSSAWSPVRHLVGGGKLSEPWP